jgi:hypothetical protein
MGYFCSFIYNLFDDVTSSSYCRIVSKGRIVNEICIEKDVYKNGHGQFLNQYPGIGLQGPRKTTKKLSQSSRRPGRVSNKAPPLFASDTLLPEPVCSVVCGLCNASQSLAALHSADSQEI